MVAYTYGPLLGILLAAILPVRTHLWGLLVGVVCSVFLVSWFRPEIPSLLIALDYKQLADAFVASRPALASEWFFPLNAMITLVCGMIGGFFFSSKTK